MTAAMVAHDCRNRGDAVEQLTIQPVKKISGTVKLPGSKSLSNRILLLAALAEGTTVVRNLLVGWAASQDPHLSNGAPSCSYFP